jgi:hypothetical protein
MNVVTQSGIDETSLPSLTFDNFAPRSTSNCATATMLFIIQQKSGVNPVLVVTSTMAPVSNNTRTTFACPSHEAQCNGVYPSLVRTFTLAPISTQNLTHSSCPLLAAQCNAVQPYLSTLTLSTVKATRNCCKSPSRAASNWSITLLNKRGEQQKMNPFIPLTNQARDAHGYTNDSNPNETAKQEETLSRGKAHNKHRFTRLMTAALPSTNNQPLYQHIGGHAISRAV